MKTLSTNLLPGEWAYSFLRLGANHLLLMGLLTFIIFADVARGDAVSDWNATAVSVQLRIPNPNRSALVDLTYLHIAIYDAVNSIDKRYTVFAVQPPNAVYWASEEAAVHSAARRILMTFYSADSVYIDSVYQSRMSLLPNDSTTTKGIEIGNTTAVMFLALRTGDGRQANIPYVWQPLEPGVYQPTPPGAAQYQPVVPWQSHLLPFSFSSTSKFRAPGPPSLNSGTYTADFNEVKKYGSKDSTYTTPEQRETARFHTENPGVQTPRNIRLFAESQEFSLSDNARFFAQLYVSIGDALISGWDSKYFYNAWRPSTAIVNADIDGNPHTNQDASWQPLVTTPRHPEYPAAHGVVLGAFARTIKEFFGTDEISVTLTSTVTGSQHNFTNINEIYDEAVNARVWGGMHFRTSVEDGINIGKNVAQWVADNYFRIFVPVDELIYVLSLDIGTKNSMASKLRRSVNAYTDGHFSMAENWLNELLNELIDFIVNGTITAEEAQPLIHYINNYLDLIHSQLPKTAENFAPGKFELLQNYPNPFNPSTTIKYSIPASGFVTLKIYDVLGREVTTLVNDEKPAGTYQVQFNAAELSSGIYLYTLQAGGNVQTKKLILVK